MSTLIVLIISLVLAAVVGGLIEYLLDKVLPVAPTLRHIAAIVIAILIFGGGAVYLPSLLSSNEAVESIITLRATDEAGNAIDGVNVLLVFSTGSSRGLTDSDGIVSLLPTTIDSTARIIANKQGYMPYEANIPLEDQTLHIRLEPIDVEGRPIFIRVVDSGQKAISGAAVTLVLEGGLKYDDLADSDGFVSFLIDFSSPPLNGELFVTFEDTETSKLLVLGSGIVVLDVQIDTQSGELQVLDAMLQTAELVDSSDEATRPSSSPQIGDKISSEGFEAQLLRVFGSGRFVTVEVLLKNISDEDKTFRWISFGDGSHLLDEKTGERYFIGTQDIFPSQTVTLEPSGTIEIWAKYEIRNEERPQELSIKLPNGLRFDNVSVVWE